MTPSPQRNTPADDPETARIVAKISWRLLPLLVAGFFVAYLDRVNIGFAALTMNREMGFAPEFYGWAAGVFFIGYCLFEAPSNYALHRFGARLWIARIMVSWGLVAAVGAYLLYRQIAPYLTSSANAADSGAHAHSHDHHDHGPNCSCGHSHMPAPEDLQGAWSWRKALPLALSVGIRPCSGAILLLIFALSQGMLWAGIAGTFAMALGTAITVSLLAALAVTSRDWAAKASGPGSVWAERLQTAAGFIGAGLVFVLGTAFFFASLNGPAPL